MQDSVYGLLYKVTEAKRQCIQEGHHRPTKEQIAARCGITVDKLQRLLCVVRTPLSMEQAVWAEQNTTYQVVIGFLDRHLFLNALGCMEFY